MWPELALQLLRSCLVVLSALFPIVNPLGNAPIFLSLTPGYSTQARVLLARKIALNSFWLLMGSMLVGSHRPTVTIALQKLAREGLLIRESSNRWLLTKHAIDRLDDPDSLSLIGGGEEEEVATGLAAER